jgi:hypothetical protein
VGLTEEGTGSVTLTFLNGGMGSTDGETGSTTLALFRGRVGLTEEGTGSVTLALIKGGMGSTDGGIDHLSFILQGKNGVDGWKQIDRFGVTL